MNIYAAASLFAILILLYWKHKERKDNHIKFTW